MKARRFLAVERAAGPEVALLRLAVLVPDDVLTHHQRNRQALPDLVEEASELRENVMTHALIPPSFTISEAALAALSGIEADMTRDDPADPPAVAMVGWGLFYDKQNRKQLENVVVSFYPRSMLAEIRHGIFVVSGIELVFFVTEMTSRHFDGKVLDFADDRWFFLRNP
ncbi:MAG TPA: hypothetical protein VN541_09080 [Tepidisphaeraceae bacterium]|nr:hypothetical protein [Tepidisphaeraceae bacterium]